MLWLSFIIKSQCNFLIRSSKFFHYHLSSNFIYHLQTFDLRAKVPISAHVPKLTDTCSVMRSVLYLCNFSEHEISSSCLHGRCPAWTLKRRRSVRCPPIRWSWSSLPKHWVNYNVLTYSCSCRKIFTDRTHSVMELIAQGDLRLWGRAVCMYSVTYEAYGWPEGLGVNLVDRGTEMVCRYIEVAGCIFAVPNLRTTVFLKYYGFPSKERPRGASKLKTEKQN
jgi:hypothetical protein